MAWPIGSADARSFAPRSRLLHQRLSRLQGYKRLVALKLRKHRLAFWQSTTSSTGKSTATIKAVAIPAIPLPPDAQAILDAPVDVLKDLLVNQSVLLEHRQMAALLLGKYGSEDTLPALVTGLADPAQALQQACMLALTNFPGDDVDAVLLEKLAYDRGDTAQVAAVTLAQRGLPAGVLYLIEHADGPHDILDLQRGLPVGPWRILDNQRALEAIRQALHLETGEERRYLLKVALAAVMTNVGGRPLKRPDMLRRTEASWSPWRLPGPRDSARNVTGPASEPAVQRLKWEEKGSL